MIQRNAINATDPMFETASRDLGQLYETWRYEEAGESDRERARLLCDLAKASDTLRSFILGYEARHLVLRVQAAHAMCLLNRSAPGAITEAISDAYETRRAAE